MTKPSDCFIIAKLLLNSWNACVVFVLLFFFVKLVYLNKIIYQEWKYGLEIRLSFMNGFNLLDIGIKIIYAKGDYIYQSIDGLKFNILVYLEQPLYVL